MQSIWCKCIATHRKTFSFNSQHEKRTACHAIPGDSIYLHSAFGRAPPPLPPGEGTGGDGPPGTPALVYASVPARNTPSNSICGSLPRHLVLDSNCRPALPWETATPGT